MASTSNHTGDNKPNTSKVAIRTRTKTKAKAKETKPEEEKKSGLTSMAPLLKKWTGNSHPDSHEHQFKNEDDWNRATDPFKSIQKELDDKNTTLSRKKELSQHLKYLAIETFMPNKVPENSKNTTDQEKKEKKEAYAERLFGRHEYPRETPNK